MEKEPSTAIGSTRNAVILVKGMLTIARINSAVPVDATSVVDCRIAKSDAAERQHEMAIDAKGRTRLSSRFPRRACAGLMATFVFVGRMSEMPLFE